MTKPFPEVREDFHMHLYFDTASRPSAMALRARLAAGEVPVELQPVRDAPIGPHTTPMFNMHADRADFCRVVTWLMLNHGPHSVLIHPNTGDDLKDHTVHALWLGPALPLALDKL